MMKTLELSSTPEFMDSCIFPTDSRLKPQSNPPVWTVACQVPLSMGFSRQEYWSGIPCPYQGIFLTQDSNPGLPHLVKTLYHLSYQRSPSDPQQAFKFKIREEEHVDEDLPKEMRICLETFAGLEV